MVAMGLWRERRHRTGGDPHYLGGNGELGRGRNWGPVEPAEWVEPRCPGCIFVDGCELGAADNTWRSVAWGGPPGREILVAVADSGTGNRVMTSPDGVT